MDGKEEEEVEKNGDGGGYRPGQPASRRRRYGSDSLKIAGGVRCRVGWKMADQSFCVSLNAVDLRSSRDCVWRRFWCVAAPSEMQEG